MSMKTGSLLLFLGLSLISGLSLGKAYVEEKSELGRKLTTQNADRLLLVAYSDNSINSIKSTASPSSYRQRGSYGSSTWSARISDQLAEEYDLEKLTEWPMTEVDAHCVVYRLRSPDVILKEVIALMSKDDRVDIVQSMNTFNTKGNISDDPYLKLQTNLQQMQINQAHKTATGKNVTIGMIDTGVDLDHPDLAGQISKNQNLAEVISTSFSTDKHGTAVAGVMVAKKGNAKGIIGVAPNARLVALKACWPDKAEAIEAICNSFTLALAVNTAIKSGVNIINMSLSGPQDPLLTLLLNKALKKGIIVVASDSGSGNAQENFPASLKDVISVKSYKHSTSPFDFKANSISAPGEKVLTTLPYGTYDFISGSSIAAAEISGVLALLLEIKPDLTSDEAYSILQKSKISSKDGVFSGVNANIALNSLCEHNPCSQEILSFARMSHF
jgi:subtilisin family serine protease